MAGRFRENGLEKFFAFMGREDGAWRVDFQRTVAGEGLDQVGRIGIVGPGTPIAEEARWVLRGVPSHERYTTRVERDELRAIQEGLGRPASTRAALIPIRKHTNWWGLAQDERRTILEERSRHIRAGLAYLPAIARRLYHCRDLGEPFDFLTWFEFAPEDSPAFEDLVGALRRTEEWQYVDREVDFRLTLV